MTLFEQFFLAHLVGDFLLQTSFEATNKARGKFFNRALLGHCLKYTACIMVVILFHSGNPLWGAWVLGTHLVLDRRWFVAFWCKRVMRNPVEVFWLTIVVDQIFHLLVLGFICALS